MNHDRHLLAQFLRPLSMTCKAMRLRSLPWVWDLIGPSRRGRDYAELTVDFFGEPHLHRKFCACECISGYHREVRLCPLPVPGPGLTRVLPRYMTMCLPFIRDSPAFVNCLGSLSNLHTLEIVSKNIRWRESHHLEHTLRNTHRLHEALIIPPAVRLLLKPCSNAEEVPASVIPNDFFGSLSTIRDSKIKRMAIPLISLGDSSRK